MRIFPSFPERLSKLFNIPCLQYISIISHLEAPGALTAHSRKFHLPEGLGISEGPWMKDYESACELEQLCFLL